MSAHVIGFLVFDGVTQLDLTGPVQVLHRVPGARVELVAPRPGPIATDCGFSILPTCTVDTCPPLTMLCVPGGYGVEAILKDPALLAWVAARGAEARWVTSVCTGALVLGAAGLLRGRRATTHWGYVALLAQLGAVHTAGRVVVDGPVVTGGGVTAGVDFALVVAAALAGESVAREIALTLEYAPEPPFGPASADAVAPDVAARLDAAFAARRAVLGALLPS
jgi:cyclohexyl-isocyanide hydratase